MASSAKFVAFAALLLMLNMHWAASQYSQCGCNNGYPVYYERGCQNNNDLDNLLPLLILALSGRGGIGGNGGCGCGCGGCSSCGRY